MLRIDCKSRQKRKRKGKNKYIVFTWFTLHKVRLCSKRNHPQTMYSIKVYQEQNPQISSLNLTGINNHSHTPEIKKRNDTQYQQESSKKRENKTVQATN